MAVCTDGQMSRWQEGQMARKTVGQKSRWPEGQLVRKPDILMTTLYIGYIKQIQKKIGVALATPLTTSLAQEEVGKARTTTKEKKGLINLSLQLSS